MAYEVRYTPIANMGLANLEKNEPKAFAKAVRLLEEIQEHPRTGTGHPEQLSGDLTGKWSRRINKKHRLIYQIHDMEVIVVVISAYGHYSDK